LNFFVVASSASEDLASPDGWVVDGAEALIELVLHLGDVRFAVHVMARKEADASVTLCQVSGLWKEVEVKDSNVAGYWYATTDGQTRPCSPVASAKSVDRPRLVKVLSFQKKVGT
jgi:hypothetical protein